MKNLKNLLPLFAFVLGLGLVFTQSAFTGKVDEPTHYNAAGDNQPVDWQPLGTKVIGELPGQYSCDDMDDRECLATKVGSIYNPVAFGEFVLN